VTTEYSGGGDPQRSIELLWGLQQPPARGPKPRLTVREITQAAIGLADSEGLAALSMRRVAEQLGTSAMSLYTYVPGKAELIDLMLDTVYGETVTAGDAGSDWRAGLESIARKAWALYLRHPWLLQVATARPPLGPNTSDKYEHDLRTVSGIGLTEIEMDSVVTVVLGYVHGTVRGAVAAAQAVQRTGMTDSQWWAAHAPLLEQVMDADRYPIAGRVGTVVGETYGAASVDPEEVFEFGLQRLLDGIAHFIRPRRETGPPTLDERP
jgi:AcrR family transcriptional regulator